MRVGITYNIKKENSEEHDKLVHSKKIPAFAGMTKVIENYASRISDKYAEWDEPETIEAVRKALKKNGHEVILIEADEKAYEKLRSEKPEIVFNIAEGFGGAARESYIPAILEMLEIPYTASDPSTTCICHDKSRCKEVLSFYNIPTPKGWVADFGNDNGMTQRVPATSLRSPQIIGADNGMTQRVPAAPRKAGLANHRLNGGVQFPYFVKPLYEGSSKGIYNSSVVRTQEELNNEINRINSEYNQPALIEEYLEGREFTVSILGNTPLNPLSRGDFLRILPIIEINFGCIPDGFNKIFSYEVKWYFDTRENKLDIYRCPAKISGKLRERIEEICLKAYRALRIRDWARIDIRCDLQENPYIIEVNPLPGILPNPDDNSCFPRAAREAGIGYDELINKVLDLAAERYGIASNVRDCPSEPGLRCRSDFVVPTQGAGTPRKSTDSRVRGNDKTI